ncbi:MAG TPA: YebC/PmpR family DNA-binding transcriptional regulator [Candidatus Dependentiae bacterium]|nr:YebC/PmpR family DNA-binding transcriptional regulator [Candidatus Dependentiae bacterium]
MSGHNKWSQIKHKKAKEDAKRGAAFTKLIKEITVSARTGGGNPEANSHLRMLLDKAKEINMPQENVTRAIKRGTGEFPGVTYEQFTYEGYGPFGIAIIVDTLSDNKNRTVAELRRFFSNNGGNLGESGSVSWMFDNLGVIHATGQITEDELLEQLLEYDIKDLRCNTDFFSVYCDPKTLESVKKIVEKIGLTIDSAELEWVAKNILSLTDNQYPKALALLSVLQNHEDVQNVYTNLA